MIQVTLTLFPTFTSPTEITFVLVIYSSVRLVVFFCSSGLLGFLRSRATAFFRRIRNIIIFVIFWNQTNAKSWVKQRYLYRHNKLPSTSSSAAEDPFALLSFLTPADWLAFFAAGRPRFFGGSGTSSSSSTLGGGDTGFSSVGHVFSMGLRLTSQLLRLQSHHNNNKKSTSHYSAKQGSNSSFKINRKGRPAKSFTC